MAKNITLAVNTTLAEKMEKFSEVVWSEVARTGIENYIKQRELEQAIIKKHFEIDDDLEAWLKGLGLYFSYCNGTKQNRQKLRRQYYEKTQNRNPKV